MFSGTALYIIRKVNNHRFIYFSYILIILGSFSLAFGIYNFYTYLNFGDTGLLGIGLFLYYKFNINPAITTVFLNLLFCILAFEHTGRYNIIYALISGLSFSIFYLILGLFPRIHPSIYDYPLLCVIFGSLLNGLGSGICIYYGNSPYYSEGLILFARDILHIPAKITYIIIDLTSILLSFTYTPVKYLPYSLICIVIKSFIAFIWRV